MYTILVKSDDTLVTSVKENIFHRTSMMHKLRFLVDPIWTKDGDSSDMKLFDCTLEYKTPISQRWTPVNLQPSSELYKDKVEYLLPIDTNMTAEVGIVEMKLTWAKLEMEDGAFKPRVRKTSEIGVEILPTAQWGDYIADANLDILVQNTLQNQAYMKQVEEYAEQIKQLTQYNTISKADNMKYDESANTLQLESMGMPIGDPVELPVGSGECPCEDGIPVVEFTAVEPEGDTEVDNVVEF